MTHHTDWVATILKAATLNSCAWLWNPETEGAGILSNIDIVLKIVLTITSIIWVYYKMKNERKTFKDRNESKLGK